MIHTTIKILLFDYTNLFLIQFEKIKKIISETHLWTLFSWSVLILEEKKRVALHLAWQYYT